MNSRIKKGLLTGGFLLVTGGAGVAAGVSGSYAADRKYPLAAACAAHQEKNDRTCSPEELRQKKAQQEEENSLATGLPAGIGGLMVIAGLLRLADTLKEGMERKKVNPPYRLDLH